MYTIVLTGGPCGGKTSALSFVAAQLRKHDFGVLTISETATELFFAGVREQLSHVDWLDFQEHIMRLQIAKEEQCRAFLSRFKNARKALLCDRGVRDGRAYMAIHEYDSLIQQLRQENIVIDNARYDIVCHLMSVAHGAEEYYNLDNEARVEKTLEEARKQDERTLDAWQGHPNHIVVDNSTDFDGKLQRLWMAISNGAGISDDI